MGTLISGECACSQSSGMELYQDAVTGEYEYGYSTRRRPPVEYDYNRKREQLYQRKEPC
jgi:hypothetical protein